DNLSHDLVRYDTDSKEAYQGVVCINDGDFEQVFHELADEALKSYLAIRSATGYVSPVLTSSIFNLLSPLRSNLTDPEYVPTNAYLLLQKICTMFPNHNLLLSDFNRLPDSIPGVDAPVVQTRFQSSMVPCSTYLVQPGYFDIFFPTNFALLKQIYLKLCPAKSDSQVQILSHSDFISQYCDLQSTSTKSGDNPIIDYYQN
ncbi:hypothetical protein HDU91_002641, partial [Kappamyces sp. JEL0680]